MSEGTTLKRVMYVSRARRRMSRGELNDMLAGARERNAAHGITGILIFDSGSFAQVLEGPAPAVDQLLANIHADQRHEDYRLLSEANVADRYFEGWAMDAANLDAYGAGAYGELKRLLADQGIADRATIYRALVSFLENQKGIRPIQA